MHTHIVKRRKGHTETYDNHKIYASCYAACVNAGCSKQEAEHICEQVMREIDAFVAKRTSVTSQELFEQTTKTMKNYHKDAAFMYETHRDIS